MFSNKDLRNLIVPLYIEQFLLMFVGIADTFVISFSSEADVSGVSLVTSFNTVLIFLFTALSSGGAVIISQYIGSKQKDLASRSAGQLLMISTVISIVMTVPILLFRMPLLHLLFGKIESDVMAACETYLFITTLSLPFLAIYDAGAAGVAYPSLLSRILSAATITVFCFHKKNAVHYKPADVFCWDGFLLKKIMDIALPNGLENGVHQLVKVARDIDAANFYFKKFNHITLVLSILWNAFVFAITPLIVRYSAISPEAKKLVIWLVLINNIFNALAYPFADSLGNGLRAAGDVKFTMIVSITLTIAARLLFSALFGLWLGWGVIGIAIGMSIDLVFRGAIFIWRLKSQKWTQFQVI